MKDRLTFSLPLAALLHEHGSLSFCKALLTTAPSQLTESLAPHHCLYSKCTLHEVFDIACLGQTSRMPSLKLWLSAQLENYVPLVQESSQVSMENAALRQQLADTQASVSQLAQSKQATLEDAQVMPTRHCVMLITMHFYGCLLSEPVCECELGWQYGDVYCIGFTK